MTFVYFLLGFFLVSISLIVYFNHEKMQYMKYSQSELIKKLNQAIAQQDEAEVARINRQFKFRGFTV